MSTFDSNVTIVLGLYLTNPSFLYPSHICTLIAPNTCNSSIMLFKVAKYNAEWPQRLCARKYWKEVAVFYHEKIKLWKSENFIYSLLVQESGIHEVKPIQRENQQALINETCCFYFFHCIFCFQLIYSGLHEDSSLCSLQRRGGVNYAYISSPF